MKVFQSTVVEDRLLQSLVPIAGVATTISLDVILQREDVLPALLLTSVIIQRTEGVQRSAGS